MLQVVNQKIFYHEELFPLSKQRAKCSREVLGKWQTCAVSAGLGFERALLVHCAASERWTRNQKDKNTQRIEQVPVFVPAGETAEG